MGSLEELEVHAYFHNYHSKLKFVGSQVLRSRPDLPVCGQVVHSSNLHPEGSEGSVCQWENCDVGASSSSGLQPGGSQRESDLRLSSRSARSTIQSGSTDTSTITSRAPSRSLWPSSSSRLSSASGRVRPRCRSHLQLPLLSLSLNILCVRAAGCDAFFKIRYRLREHMRSHTQEKLVACPTCGSMFSSNTKLFDHLHRQAEPNGKKGKLVFCSQQFLFIFF